MSRALHSLTILAAAGLALGGSPLSSEARGVTARSGSSTFFADAGCWAPFGPTMTNTTCSARHWHIPLILDGSFTGWYSATITATALSANSDVSCRLMSADQNGGIVMLPNFVDMTSHGGPSSITLSVWVPGGGTAMIDCLVNQGSSVHTVNY